MILKSHADLLQVVHTLHAIGSFVDYLDGRDEQGNQDGYHGNDDEQLYKREA